MTTQIPGSNTTIDSLMAFRLAYLRVIARYWKDPRAFKKELATKGLGWQQPGQFAHEWFLEQYCQGYEWPWNLDLQLVADDSIQYGFDDNAGWSGPPNEVLIYLPLPPPKAKDQTSAIAAYYSYFPTFWGGGVLDNGAPSNNQSKTRAAAAGGAGAGLGGPLQLGVGSVETFLEFGAVVVRAIALLWKDVGLNGEARSPMLQAFLANGNDALTKYLGYHVPWNLTFTFQKSTSMKYVPGAGNGPDSWILQPNRLTLHLPGKPDAKLYSLPIALAAYNNTGDAYPFTCGC